MITVYLSTIEKACEFPSSFWPFKIHEDYRRIADQPERIIRSGLEGLGLNALDYIL